MATGRNRRLIRFRKSRPQRGVRPAPVVVNGELKKNAPEMAAVQRNEKVLSDATINLNSEVES